MTTEHEKQITELQAEVERLRGTLEGVLVLRDGDDWSITDNALKKLVNEALREEDAQAHTDQAIHGFSATLKGKRVDPEALRNGASDEGDGGGC